MIFVLYGPPGVGKTYIGNLISEAKKTHFFDADTLFYDSLKKLLTLDKYTQSIRDIFANHLIATVETLAIKYNQNLIIAEAFTKERNRKDFANYFDNQIFFIRIKAKKELARQRVIQRLKTERKHPINEVIFEKLWNEFELSTDEKNVIINNENNNDKNILQQFDNLINKFKNNGNTL